MLLRLAGFTVQKENIQDVYTNLTDIKIMNLIAKKRNARQEEC
jgi:hypothetical protein